MSKSLFLIFHGRFPSEKAASLFAAKSAEAFADEGLKVTVLVPNRKGALLGVDAASYYGLKSNFRVIYLPVLDLFKTSLSKRLSFFVSFVTFSVSCWGFVLKEFLAGHFSSKDILYSNEWMPLLFLRTLSRSLFYEMHDFPESHPGFFGFFLRRMKWILIHNRWKAEKAIRSFVIDPKKVFCRANSVDIRQFDTQISKNDARKQLGLSAEKNLVVYTGHLYGWKGVDTLAQASLILGAEYLVAVVGGTDPDIGRFKAAYGTVANIFIAGHRPHAEMPLWQKAADVLVLPNTAKEDISKYYTSPMKLFEYMASKRPIVASRIPSIEEVVDDDQVLLVEPDSPAALAEGIRKVCADEALANRLAHNAFEKVKTNTWSARAREIIAFVSSSLEK